VVNSAPVSADASPFRDMEGAYPIRAHPVAVACRPGSGCKLVEDEVSIRSEVSIIDFTCKGDYPYVFTMAPVVARLG
jgi:hypothetical protein